MKNIKIDIIEFTDPACTWCWGSEPVLRKLETLYDGVVKINFIMGGLVKDINDFYDNMNGIGGDIKEVNRQIASHWLEASKRHGMPVEVEGFELFTESTPSTYPMNIAYKAAQFQGDEVAKKFLRRMREAVAAEAINANKMETQIELASETSLDISKFIESIHNKSAEKAFYEDLEQAKSYRVHGFPSFLIKSSDKQILLRGYQSFDTFQAVINQISNNQLVPKRIDATDENIMNFIMKYGRVAPIEIATVFILNNKDINAILGRLKNNGLITLSKTGNGLLVSVTNNKLYCDPNTGLCQI